MFPSVSLFVLSSDKHAPDLQAVDKLKGKPGEMSEDYYIFFFLGFS